MRLGYHYHIPMFRDAEGHLRTPGYQGCFLDALAGHCERLVCFLHTPRPDEMEIMDYALKAANVEWVDIGPHASVPERLACRWRLTGPLRRWRDRLDCMLIRGPSPLLPAAASAVRGLPVALLIVGDYVAGAAHSSLAWWKKLPVQLWRHWNARAQLRVAREALTFVNSAQLYEAYRGRIGRLHLTRTTTLSEADGYEREDTCTGRPVRLLYTGRMASAKGLLEIAEAVAQLVEAGEDVVLDLVGMREPGDPVLEELAAFCRRRGIEQRVTYHGYRPLGPELFAFYRRADIYVLASTSSFEGFPRAIWEAMAHSLPVVATAVGSIPHYLKDRETALLVPPRDAGALRSALEQLLRNAQLRRHLISYGRRVAASNTVEAIARDMAGLLKRYIDDYPRSAS